MPTNPVITQTRKLRRNLRKLLERVLDRVEVQTESTLAYARKLVARVSPRSRRTA